MTTTTAIVTSRSDIVGAERTEVLRYIKQLEQEVRNLKQADTFIEEVKQDLRNLSNVLTDKYAGTTKARNARNKVVKELKKIVVGL